MSEHPVLLLEKRGGAWNRFLKNYLSDTPAALNSAAETGRVAAAAFDKILPRVLFAEPSFLNKAFLQKIRVRKSVDPAFRFCLIGVSPLSDKDGTVDIVLPADPLQVDFNKRFVEILPAPETLRLLVVDDEEEIGEMVRDYLGGRTAPAFAVSRAANGQEAFGMIARERPDVIILDIKMPVMDGREFYAKLADMKLEIPVIVFFDSISGEELAEVRRYGNPAVIEKGYKGSSLSAMMLLIKKLVFFSA